MKLLHSARLDSMSVNYLPHLPEPLLSSCQFIDEPFLFIFKQTQFTDHIILVLGCSLKQTGHLHTVGGHYSRGLFTWRHRMDFVQSPALPYAHTPIPNTTKCSTY